MITFFGVYMPLIIRLTLLSSRQCQLCFADDKWYVPASPLLKLCSLSTTNSNMSC